MIGRLAAALLAGMLAGLAAPPPAAAGEAILDYGSRIVVGPDASLTVTETMRVRTEGQTIKRGIFRAFPTLYRDRLGNPVRVPFDVLDVRRDGRPEPFHVEPASNGKVVYVGRADVFLTPGEYTYTLVYRTDRQIGHFPDYDEIYWNVTGSDWTLPRLRIEAVVVLPMGPRILRHAAYTGRTGERGTDFAVDRDANDDIRFTTTRVLGPGEDLTIAVAWPKGYVAEPAAAERLWHAAGDNASAIAGTVGLLLVLAIHFAVWRRVGRDPARSTIVPLFEPPKGLSPAVVRYIMRGGFDDKAFAAAILDMAVKGALAIEADEGRFTVRRKATDAASLSPGEKKIAARLFGGGRESVEIGGAYDPIVHTARGALEDTLKGEYGRAFFSSNRLYLVPGAAASGLTLAAMIAVTPSPANAAAAVVLCGFATAMLAVFGHGGLGKWKAALAGGRPGRRRISLAVTGTLLLASSGAVAALAGRTAFEELTPAVFMLVVALVAVNALFIRLMAAPTAMGRQIMDAIEGFRMYLSVAEQARLDALHPPAMTPRVFEKYLPYALALDVETAWNERFAATLDVTGPHAEPYRPAWYSGRSWERGDGQSFTASLGDGLVGAVSASATAPGTTGDGGGSGGGGSSGGGGGGGGGGGW